MTFESEVRASTLLALRAIPGLNRVGDGEGEAGTVPYATLGEIVGSDWGAKGRPGRELRFAVTVADRGEAARIDALGAAVEAVLVALPREISGWETGGVVVIRSRRGRRRDGLMSAIIEVRVRGWLAG